jgi:GT2 family glycosyltransferase
MIDRKDVTIIVPHLGATPEQEFALDQCVKSLFETVPDMEIIIAVNGNMLCNGHDFFNNLNLPNSNLIALTKQGQCKAVNAAAATTNTPWILITNDDMIYAPGWFERLCTLEGYSFPDITHAPSIRCISPRLVEPRGGAPTFEVFFAGGAGGDFDKEKWLGYAEEHTERKYSLQTGFNFPLLIRRDLWDLIGAYDINYDPWGSNGDSDLQYKIMLAGVQPMQNPNCVVYHFSQTSGTFEPRNDSHRFRNYAYFKEKWGFERTDNRIWESDFKIPTKEEGRIFLPSWEGAFNHV